jgi:peptide chain release factor 3
MYHNYRRFIIDGVDNPKLDEILGKDVALEMREEVELIRETTTPFDLDAFLACSQVNAPHP